MYVCMYVCLSVCIESRKTVQWYFYLGSQICIQLRPENFSGIVLYAPFLSAPPTPTPCLPCPLNTPLFPEPDEDRLEISGTVPRCRNLQIMDVELLSHYLAEAEKGR